MHFIQALPSYSGGACVLTTTSCGYLSKVHKHKGQIASAPLQGLERPFLVLTEVVLVSCADNAPNFARPHPPPGECGLACCLRTTILLI